MYSIFSYNCINIVISSLELIRYVKAVELTYVPAGLIFHLLVYMCFSCYCDVIVIMMVACIMVLMSNQHPIVLGIDKDIALSSSL